MVPHLHHKGVKRGQTGNDRQQLADKIIAGWFEALFNDGAGNYQCLAHLGRYLFFPLFVAKLHQLAQALMIAVSRGLQIKAIPEVKRVAKGDAIHKETVHPDIVRLVAHVKGEFHLIQHTLQEYHPRPGHPVKTPQPVDHQPLFFLHHLHFRLGEKVDADNNQGNDKQWN